MSQRDATTHARGGGWVTFIGVMFALLGTFNAIDGVVALAGDAKFQEENLFFGDLTFWGLTLLGIGALQLFTAVLILRRNANGQGLGIILCGFNLVWQLFFVAVFPIWSLLIIAADVLIIYGLCIYDDQFK
ncbi:MAG TPA: hypothetical protein VFS73_05905 [Solirubrobacterales bacterium]|jgi:uncharacterized membrane protein|nr:hypothetical protein [Solirubrobacterales bacterium]